MQRCRAKPRARLARSGPFRSTIERSSSRRRQSEHVACIPDAGSLPHPARGFPQAEPNPFRCTVAPPRPHATRRPRAVHPSITLPGRHILAHASTLLARRTLPALAARPPRPVFPPRRDLVVTGDDDELRIVVDGKQRNLRLPIEWSPADTDAARDLCAMSWIEALDDARFQSVVRDWVHRSRARETVAHPSTTASRCVSLMQQLAVRSQRLERAFVDTASRSIAAE